MYSFIVFSIIVLPFTFKNYFSNSNYSIYARASNFFVTLILFMFFFEEFRTQIWDFYKNGIEFLFSNDLNYPFSRSYNIISNLLYFILCFYITGITLSLGLISNKRRKLFLKSLPIMWIILTNYFFQYYFINSVDLNRSKYLVFFIFGFLIGIFLIVIRKIFTNDSMKFLYGDIK